MVSNPTRSLGPLSVTASPALSLEAFSQTGVQPNTVPGTTKRDDFPGSLVGGVFSNGVQPNTVPGTTRRDVAIDNFLSGVQSVGDFIKNVLPGRDIDERQSLSGLNNFQTTDVLGNPLKFGIISGSVPGTRRDVAIDDFLSGVQNVGDFIKNVLPGRDIDVRSLFDGLLSDPQTADAITQAIGGFPGPAPTRREPLPLSAGDLSGIGKTVLGAVTSLGAADAVKNLLDPSPRDLIEALQLVSRQLDELD
ncbi:hypothetical protein H4582DRAFT_955086 [Lactarius indigo]|nr:hypothetical protein H4582DRAFT_955086 [Lactarius indigo]